jgi:hypothetical protein
MERILRLGEAGRRAAGGPGPRRRRSREPNAPRTGAVSLRPRVVRPHGPVEPLLGAEQEGDPHDQWDRPWQCEGERERAGQEDRKGDGELRRGQPRQREDDPDLSAAAGAGQFGLVPWKGDPRLDLRARRRAAPDGVTPRPPSPVAGLDARPQRRRPRRTGGAEQRDQQRKEGTSRAGHASGSARLVLAAIPPRPRGPPGHG